MPIPAGGAPPGTAGANGQKSGGGGAFPSGGAFPAAGASASGGQGGSAGYEPTEHCNSTVDAWIAFDSDAGSSNRDLYVVRPDGSHLTRLTSEVSDDIEPYFSPDGDRLAFTSDRSGTKQIFIMDLATLAVTQVTHQTNDSAVSAGFSTDGKLLAYLSGGMLFTINLDGSNPTLVSDTVSGILIPPGPRFIADDRLVFADLDRINVIDLDTTKVRTVIDGSAQLLIGPTVSPLNDEIAYAAQCSGSSDGFSIWTAPADVTSLPCTGQRVSPAFDPANNMNPSWGPVDTFVYERIVTRPNDAQANGRITLNRRASGSVPCSLTPATQDSRNPNWSREGVKLPIPTL